MITLHYIDSIHYIDYINYINYIHYIGCIHYIPTYIPTYVPTYQHTYLHTYIHACVSCDFFHFILQIPHCNHWPWSSPFTKASMVACVSHASSTGTHQKLISNPLSTCPKLAHTNTFSLPNILPILKEEHKIKNAKQ